MSGVKIGIVQAFIPTVQRITQQDQLLALFERAVEAVGTVTMLLFAALRTVVVDHQRKRTAV